MCFVPFKTSFEKIQTANSSSSRNRKLYRIMRRNTTNSFRRLSSVLLVSSSARLLAGQTNSFWSTAYPFHFLASLSSSNSSPSRFSKTTAMRFPNGLSLATSLWNKVSKAKARVLTNSNGISFT
jgi:hypothetical protein